MVSTAIYFGLGVKNEVFICYTIVRDCIIVQILMKCGAQRTRPDCK